jgi:hypothetical protein
MLEIGQTVFASANAWNGARYSTEFKVLEIQGEMVVAKAVAQYVNGKKTQRLDGDSITDYATNFDLTMEGE